MNVYKAAETEDFSDCVERASIVCVCALIHIIIRRSTTLPWPFLINRSRLLRVEINIWYIIIIIAKETVGEMGVRSDSVRGSIKIINHMHCFCTGDTFLHS